MSRKKQKRKNGKSKDGSYKRHSRMDIIRINLSYRRKLEEYKEMSLEDLENISATKLGGSYRLAYLQALAEKKNNKNDLGN